MMRHGKGENEGRPTERSYTPNELDPLCPLPTRSTELDTPSDDIVQQTNRERRSAPPSEQQHVLVLPQANAAPSIGTIEHDLHGNL